MLGGAYQIGRTWYYPRQSFDAEETGLASVQQDGPPRLTADGEAFDQRALAGAHQTLQLPCIVRLTNLENGRTLAIRINDRGPASPARLVAVTRRVAALLGFGADRVARVRLTVLGGPSRALATTLGGDAGPRLEIAAAPREAVEQVELPPPTGAAQAARSGAFSVSVPKPADSPQPVLHALPGPLSEIVTQASPDAGSLYVRMSTFSRREFAERQRARVAGLRPQIEQRGEGRSATFDVRVGPIGSVAQADRDLEQAISAGIPDARIVVE